MSYIVVVVEKGAVDDIDTLRASVDSMMHGNFSEPVEHNPGHSVRLYRFTNPPLAVFAKGAVSDLSIINQELQKGVAIIEINPGHKIEFAGH